ncbi:hypothetical protein MLD38_000689 [Melastoma candidum]|uniref:Uncharacterized protein n=1 Tax=Melastoma candidum TaxID=119954 RepID=A0ACB9SBT2_9MYRT|nr:hypothetical protein MLD38_000689 [Melastoma candidum]
MGEAERETPLKTSTNIDEVTRSVPVQLPFTAYSWVPLQGRGHSEDLITWLLSNGEGDDKMNNEEIMDYSLVSLFAGLDTSTVAICFVIRSLSLSPGVYAGILRGMPFQGSP